MVTNYAPDAKILKILAEKKRINAIKYQKILHLLSDTA